LHLESAATHYILNNFIDENFRLVATYRLYSKPELLDVARISSPTKNKESSISKCRLKIRDAINEDAML